MDGSPLSQSDYEKEEEIRARKKEVISSLRGLVAHPGWAYLCMVLEQQRIKVLLSLKEATTQDELIRLNLDLREAETYLFLAKTPDSIINEFTATLGADDGE